MADSIDILKKLALQIRNAIDSGENTAERVGRTFVGIIDFIKNLENIFLHKDIPDTAIGHIKFKNGETVENGLIVRLPPQNSATALVSCLLEENPDTIIEENEDAIMEFVAPSGELTFGGLNNVSPSVDNAPAGSIPVMGQNEWGYVSPVSYTGNIDTNNMLVPVYDRKLQSIVFIPISVIQGGSPPVPTGFPYTFPFVLN